MKKYLIVAILVAAFWVLLTSLFGCKARKVASEKKDSTSVSSTIKSASESAAHVDTGKVSSTKVTEQRKMTNTDDSSHTETTITPKPGTLSTVDPDGTFHGEIESMSTKRKTGKKQTEVLDSKIQETAGEIKGISDTYKADSSSVQKDSTHVASKIKKVDAKPSYGAWPWVIGIVIVLVVVIGLWWFFGRPKGK